MRRYFAILMLIGIALMLVLSTGCPKHETVRDTAEEGEEQPDPGPDGPRPPGGF